MEQQKAKNGDQFLNQRPEKSGTFCATVGDLWTVICVSQDIATIACEEKGAFLNRRHEELFDPERFTPFREDETDFIPDLKNPATLQKAKSWVAKEVRNSDAADLDPSVNWTTADVKPAEGFVYVKALVTFSIPFDALR